MKKLVSISVFVFAFISFVCTSLAAVNVKERPDISIVIDGKTGDYSAVPIEVNGRTLLPLREVLVNLGVQNDDSHIIWNNSEQSVNIIKDSTTIYLQIAKDKAKVNGRDITLSAAPVMHNSKTYIPARFVAESLGKKVVWDDDFKKVLITDNASFNKISSLLNNARNKLSTANKFKIAQTYKSEMNSFGFSNTVSIKGVHKVDQKSKLALGNISISTKSGSSNEEESFELFCNGNILYSKEASSGTWEESDLTGQQLQDENTKIFDAYYFLKPSEVLCASVAEDKASDINEILIKGSVFPHELMRMMLRNSDVLKQEDFQNGELEIIIDKTTGLIKKVNTKFSNSSMLTVVNFDCTWESTEIDGSFQVEPPSGLAVLAGINNDVVNGEKQMNLGNYEEAIKYFDKALQTAPKTSRAISGKFLSLYYLGKFNESLAYIEKYNEIVPDDSDLFTWKAKNYIQLRQYDKAIEECDNALSIDEISSFAYNVKAIALKYKGKYKEALDSVNKAIELEEDYSEAYVNKIAILYYSKKYDECIHATNIAQALEPKNEEIPWFRGDCYSALQKHENAIKAFQEAMLLNPENDIVVSNIGWEYYYLENYSKAEEYLEKALKLNSENQDALSLREYIKHARLPEGQKLVDFIKSNYLYFDKTADFDRKSKDLLTKSNISAQDASSFINSVKLSDDIFTFVISGKEYDEYNAIEQNNNVSSKKLSENNYYIKINNFTTGVSNEVRKFIDTINNTEAANLIIDLRDNGGGLTTASNEILDYLLPECTTSFMINRDGQMYQYYSDENQVKFNKIIVMVNEYSASSSELLTLGLKKYLNNVVIIGKPTFGKGVGQFVYEDKKDKFMVFLVSFYWNVKEQNIMGSKITPDVTVKGTKDSDYFNEVNKIK